MPFEKVWLLSCDSCGEYMQPAPRTFTSEHQATRIARAEGWYVDGVRWFAKDGTHVHGRLRCPKHHPGWKRDSDAEQK